MPARIWILFLQSENGKLEEKFKAKTNSIFLGEMASMTAASAFDPR